MDSVISLDVTAAAYAEKLTDNCDICYLKISTNLIHQHIERHFASSVVVESFRCLPCHKSCAGPAKSHGHYHCPLCKEIKRRKVDFVTHIEKTCKKRKVPRVAVTKKGTKEKTSHLDKSKNVEITPIEEKVKKHRYKSTECPLCNKSMLLKNVKRHLDTQHKKTGEKHDITSDHHLRGMCVDQKNSIYLISKEFHGFQQPLHCQFNTETKEIFCESKQCEDLRNLFKHSNEKYFLCKHLRSIQYCNKFPDTTEDITQEEIDNFLHHGLLTRKTHATARLLLNKANSEGVPLFVSMRYDYPADDQYVFFSLFHGDESRYWGKVGRVVLKYNINENIIKCDCSPSRQMCIHRKLLKCKLTMKSPEPPRTEEFTESTYPGQHAESVFSYLLNEKEYPTQPKEKLVSGLVEICPMEEKCYKCGSDSLTKKLVTKEGIIYCLDEVPERNLRVFVKECDNCGFFYRYQEHTDGIHNFNDRVFMTFKLLLWLRCSIMKHIPVGSFVDMIEMRIKETISHQDMLNGYLLFEALTDHSYLFHCLRCGYHPSILIFDADRKGVFHLNVSKVKEVECNKENDRVDCDVFWQKIRTELISRGFETDKEKFKVTPQYDSWAPWIGVKSRASNLLYNTEHHKLAIIEEETQEEEFDENISSDIIAGCLWSLNAKEIKKICKTMKVSHKGTKNENINKLQKRVSNRTGFNKLFECIWGGSGGWLTSSCHHGVVYGVKFLMRAESERDHIDLLKSYKYQPTFTISDMPHLLVRHGHKRFPGMFQPHDGMFFPPTKENVEKAKKGLLKTNFDSLKAENLPGEQHPNSKLPHKLCLVDWFHQYNCKSDEQYLRRLSLCSDLGGKINSESSEQLHSQMNMMNKFIDVMGSSSHIFLLRLALHFHNEQENEKYETTVSRLNRVVKTNKHGFLVLDNKDERDHSPRTSGSESTVTAESGSIYSSSPEKNHRNIGSESTVTAESGSIYSSSPEQNHRSIVLSTLLEPENILPHSPETTEINNVISQKSVDNVAVPKGFDTSSKQQRLERFIHGLHNPKYLCWLNSSLQALKHWIPEIQVDVYRQSHCNVMEEVQLIINALRSERRVSDYIQMKLAKKLSSQFPPDSEHDIGEFMILVIGEMVQASVLKGIVVEYDSCCFECHHVSTVSETENILNLALSESVQQSVYSALNDRHELKDNNALFCEMCKKHVTGDRGYKVLSMPDNLIIQIGRWSDVINGEIQHKAGEIKLDREIKVPIHPDAMFIFNLKAVQCHKGTLHAGHYWTVAVENEQAILYNDRDVSMNETVDEALNESQEYAYVLHYVIKEKQKIPAKESLPRQQRHPTQRKDYTKEYGSERAIRLEPKKRRRSSCWEITEIVPRSKRHCICNQPEDKRLYIQCDKCHLWFHCSCLEIEEEIANALNVFLCSICCEKERTLASMSTDNLLNENLKWVDALWLFDDVNIDMPVTFIHGYHCSWFDLKTIAMKWDANDHQIMKDHGYNEPPGWLNCNIVNSFLKVVVEKYSCCQKEEIVAVDSLVAASILAGKENIRIQINALIVKRIIIPLYTPRHWTLLIINIERSSAGITGHPQLYNPLGSLLKPNLRMLSLFLEKSHINLSQRVEVTDGYSHIQTDLCSCGILILMKAFYIARGLREKKEYYSKDVEPKAVIAKIKPRLPLPIYEIIWVAVIREVLHVLTTKYCILKFRKFVAASLYLNGFNLQQTESYQKQNEVMKKITEALKDIASVNKAQRTETLCSFNLTPVNIK